LSYALVAIFVGMIAMAHPRLRTIAHDGFEATHRFLGWFALVLVWANTVVFAISRRGAESVATALLASPTVWILVVTTFSAALPWLRLRKVPITVHRPSSHVAVVGFNHRGMRPFGGSARAISHHPLFGWHSFANSPGATQTYQNGYRMLVSRAGDWTSAFIDNPPSHVWIRGIPTAGASRVRVLFTRVLYIATGTGIAPMLAHLLDREAPGHLVWVTRDPSKTYGDVLVNEILAARPDATIWNTDEHGKPDMVKLAYAAYVRTGAEAVICIGNKKITWRVVFGLEQRGIPAFGPVFDS
jgi:hypothetical protein